MTDTAPKRTRRAEPITKHTAKNGTTSYWFVVDTGTRPDGSRDRQRFTYRTKAEAQREYRRITTEVASGTYVRRHKATVAEFLTEWLDGRRKIRPVTLTGYRHALKPVIEHLGGVALQHLETRHIDDLVTLRLSGAPVAQRDKRGKRSAEVLTRLWARPDGAGYGEMHAEFGNTGRRRWPGSWPLVRSRACGAASTWPHSPPTLPGPKWLAASAPGP